MNTNELNGVVFRVNYTEETSIHNWFEQYHLTCKSSLETGYIGSSFFVGAFFGSFVIPRAADVVGRKPMFILGLCIYICVTIGLMFATNYYVLLALLICSGVGECGRYYVAYVYAIEIFPQHNQSIVGVLIFICFSIAKVCICLQFWLIPSRNWFGCAYASLILAIVSLVLTLWWMPESPRYLYSYKKFDEVTKILEHIQKVNNRNLKY